MSLTYITRIAFYTFSASSVMSIRCLILLYGCLCLKCLIKRLLLIFSFFIAHVHQVTRQAFPSRALTNPLTLQLHTQYSHSRRLTTLRFSPPLDKWAGLSIPSELIHHSLNKLAYESLKPTCFTQLSPLYAFSNISHIFFEYLAFVIFSK